MTDDSPSRHTEGEEPADEDGRASDPEQAVHERDEETPHESDDTPTDDERTDEITPMDDERADEVTPTDDARTDDIAPTDDEPEASDSPADQSTVAGNPMAGVEPDADDAERDDTGHDDEHNVNEEPAPDGPVAEDADADGTPMGAAIPEGIPTGDSEPEGTPAEGDQPPSSPGDFIPEDVQKYERFKKMDSARYDRVNEFLRDRTYVTAREWAIARLCADFRTETGVEMTKIGENLPRLVPFMEDTYTPQAVNQARHSFEEKVRKSGATFLYGAMSGFFTAEQLDDVMYEITEVAKFLLEVEGVDLSVEEELEAEDRILSVMREVREQSEQLRHEGATCPECGHEIGGDGESH